MGYRLVVVKPYKLLWIFLITIGLFIGLITDYEMDGLFFNQKDVYLILLACFSLLYLLLLPFSKKITLYEDKLEIQYKSILSFLNESFLLKRIDILEIKKDRFFLIKIKYLNNKELQNKKYFFIGFYESSIVVLIKKLKEFGVNVIYRNARNREIQI